MVGGLQGSTFTYIKYIYGVSSWQHQAGSNVAAEWLQIDSRTQIAAVCVREKKIVAV
jgi:hypothetical protein